MNKHRKCMKKIIVVLFVNVMAFAGMLNLVYSEMGASFYYKMLLPAIVMYATNTGTSLVVISIVDYLKTKEKDKTIKTEDDSLPE